VRSHPVSLHDCLPMCPGSRLSVGYWTGTGSSYKYVWHHDIGARESVIARYSGLANITYWTHSRSTTPWGMKADPVGKALWTCSPDRKSTRLNSSHVSI